MNDAHDDAQMARLLRLAGLRPVPTHEQEHRVRVAVLGAIREQAARRRRRRVGLMLTGGLAAAAALAIAVRTTPDTRGPAAASGAVAFGAIERTQGPVARVQRDTAGREEPLPPDGSVQTGDVVVTGAQTRVAIRHLAGTSIRIDRASRVGIVSPETLDLQAGAIYVDRPDAAMPLTIRTPQGTVRDIGTQFEMRVQPGSLRIRVRTGVVELSRGTSPLAVRAGTELSARETETNLRPMAVHGPDWEWAVELAPPFQADGRPLAALLAHVSREQGWTLRYAPASLADDVTGIVVHGSMTGVSMVDQLGAALAASGLEHEVEAGSLVVRVPAVPR